MGSGKFYFRSANSVKNFRKSRFVRSFLVAGIILLSMPFTGKAQSVPSFVAGASTPVTVCQNSSANDIGSYLAITDADSGPSQIETWHVVSNPTQGVLNGFDYYDVATGGTVTPAPGNLTYTPNPGYIGNDMFVIAVDNAPDGADTIIVNVVVSALPSLVIDAIPPVCAGATSTTLSFSALSMVGPTTSTFINHNAADVWTVPPGVTSVSFDVQGAVGGIDNHSTAPNPGNGGRVTGNLTVTPGQNLYIYAGGAGQGGTLAGAAGGWNGGGNATYYFFGCGGAGGGASDIRVGGTSLNNRVVVAGGGGGNGWDAPGPSLGGAGGGLIGGSGGSNVGGGHAGGGTQFPSGGAGATYTGWASGGNGSVGVGGDGSTQGLSGGGGGGYYGGGGGVWSGGGGGSSYANAGLTSSVLHTSGYNIGDGVVSLSYNVPGTYTIIWDPTAHTQGFVDVSAATLPSSPITIAVPPTALPTTYYGTLYIANSTCTSVGYPISVTINPIPDVAVPDNQTLCNGDPTAVTYFSGSVPGTTYSWTNDMPSIGLPASGTGDIGSFTATNTSSSPQTATITITPSANSCSGSPVSFSITTNPTPMLTSTLTPPAVCDSQIFNYTPTSATGGSTFTWFRTTITGITTYGAPSGAGNPADYLDNTTSDPIAYPYTYVISANGCSNTQVVTVTVNPTPMLSSALNAGAICNNSLFSYIPTSLTGGTSFTWNRNLTTGISNTPFTGTGNPNETLHNTTNDPVAVPYIYTLVANGCVNHQTVIVTVNPTPTLNSGLSPAAVCNNTLFTYAPGSATAGTSFAWSRGSITGISNLPNSGLDTINEALINTTPDPVAVTYTYTMTANGCANTQNVVVIVNPKPMLSSALNPTVCDSTVFNYPPTSLTAGTTFTWTRAAVLGISNLADAGTGNPNETLINTTPAPVIVTYVFTLSANGCSNMQNVSLTVNPKPMLSSTLTPPAICDSNLFSYNPASNTAGCTYSWYRPYIPGIYAVAASGTGNPSQNLINSTYVVVDVTYIYTVTANGCSNVQEVVVPVNPTPRLNPPFTGTVCSGSAFHYTPTSYTPGALYTWNRPLVNHITPPTSFAPTGTGVIDEKLFNDQLTPVYVDYIYRLAVNGCPNLITQTVKVKVNPTPAVPDIIVYPSSNLCAGTMFQNFGTSHIQDGVEYVWTATNADVVATGLHNQYALVTFNTPGTSVVTLTTNVAGYGCTNANSYTVNVSNSVASTPQVIYFNGQFICLQNDNDFYQWGYDDATTLDSTILTGEIDQNYNNSNPDFSTKHYWVITGKEGCSQKAYYNRPTGISNINAGESSLKVYPNPASDVVNVEMNSSVNGNYDVEVFNMLGQKLTTQSLVNHRASINVATLPAGFYVVECHLNGEKVATTRFIKN